MLLLVRAFFFVLFQVFQGYSYSLYYKCRKGAVRSHKGRFYLFNYIIRESYAFAGCLGHLGDFKFSHNYISCNTIYNTIVCNLHKNVVLLFVLQYVLHNDIMQIESLGKGGKIMKRILALLLTCVMFCTLLAGCGCSEEPKTKSHHIIVETPQE